MWFKDPLKKHLAKEWSLDNHLSGNILQKCCWPRMFVLSSTKS